MGCTEWGPVPAGTAGDPTKNPSEGAQGLLNNNASNPFGSWTAIFVEYCDGTSYTSDRAQPVTVGKDKIYYRGWRILNALIDDWLTQGMDNAGAVILSGTSAGGLTTYQHAEYIKSRLPVTTRVVAAPDAGFFLDLPDVDGVFKWRASLNQGFATWNGTGLGLCIRIAELCVRNDEFCVKNDELCIQALKRCLPRC